MTHRMLHYICNSKTRPIQRHIIVMLLFALTGTQLSGSSLDLSGLKFCIDAGHGGTATGAVGPAGLTEKEINLQQALDLNDFLMSNGADTVILTRATDSDLSLSEREMIANNHDVDYFISLHHNGSSSHQSNYSLCLYGETEAGSPRWPDVADALSKIISGYHSETKNISDIGARGDVSFLGFQLGVLNDLTMPGVLSEPSFITNGGEERRLTNNDYLKTEAQATLYSYLQFLEEELPTYGTVVGVAKSSEGKPINHTVIMLETHTDSSVTDGKGNGYFRIENIPAGNYRLTAFNEIDTTEADISVGNGDILFKKMVLDGPESPFIPVFEQPVLHHVRRAVSAEAVEISWFGTEEEFVAGYHLFRSENPNGNYGLLMDETVLTRNITSWTDTTVESGNYYSYYYYAVDTSGQHESNVSDRYPVYLSGDSPEVLIVDGFDRIASWGQPHHAFATVYGKVCAEQMVAFDCTSNDAVENGTVSLEDYDVVLWFFGDEGTADETFSTQEQPMVKVFLEEGGKLFVTGSEVGWDLAREEANPEDTEFYRSYLKANYGGDDAGNLTVSGLSGAIFEGMSFSIGQTYPEDFPDYIAAAGGSLENLQYGNDRYGGIQYEGTFGEGSRPGKLVYMAFPLETIGDTKVRSDLIAAILDFFEVAGTVDVALSYDFNPSPNLFSLGPLYPNPSNASIIIPLTVNRAETRLTLTVINLLGQKVLRKDLGKFSSGRYDYRWNLRNSSLVPIQSGMYSITVSDGEQSETRKVTVVR